MATWCHVVGIFNVKKIGKSAEMWKNLTPMLLGDSLIPHTPVGIHGKVDDVDLATTHSPYKMATATTVATMTSVSPYVVYWDERDISVPIPYQFKLTIKKNLLRLRLHAVSRFGRLSWYILLVVFLLITITIIDLFIRLIAGVDFLVFLFFSISCFWFVTTSSMTVK